MKKIGLIKGEKEKANCMSDFSIDVPGEILRTFDHTKSHSSKQESTTLNARITSVKAHIIVSQPDHNINRVRDTSPMKTLSTC